MEKIIIIIIKNPQTNPTPKSPPWGSLFSLASPKAAPFSQSQGVQTAGRDRERGERWQFFPGIPVNLEALVWLGPPRHRFWDGKLSLPSQGDSKERSVSPQHGDLGQGKLHPTQTWERREPASQGRTHVQLHGQDEDKSSVSCSCGAQGRRDLNRGEAERQKLEAEGMWR